MAKKAILDVLENTIGRYVHNLDAESLNVAVWSGKIELNSLRLNVEAVNAELGRRAAEAPNLAVPFRVIDGSFQSFRVDVPWARITSRPVVLRARGLKVFVEPYDHLSSQAAANTLSPTPPSTPGASYKSPLPPSPGRGSGKGAGGTPRPDQQRKKKKKEARAQSLEMADEARNRANALRKLAAIDEGHASADVSDGATKDSSRGDASTSFGARLVRRIIENLQIDIDDVHVALRDCGCSAGLVLESLSLVTTDENGNRTFVDRATNSQNVADSFLYKVLRIKGLGLYLDDDDRPSRVSGPSLERFEIATEDMRSAVASTQPDGHSYILSPLSFEAKLRQSDCVQCVDFPKYLVSSELSQLSILLSRRQLELGNRIAVAIQPKKGVARPLFPEYRPDEPIGTGSAREWWRYSVRCIGRLNRRRSWTEFYNAFQKRKAYIPLYKRAAYSSTCPWVGKQLSDKEKAQLDAIESDRSISVEGIMCWRNIADAQVEWEKKKRDAKEEKKRKARAASASTVASTVAKSNPKKSSFLSSLFGGPGGGGNEDVTSEKQLLGDITTTSSEDEPPISLTIEEMKELELISVEQAAATDLSSDSMLCDVKFTLGSFKVDLVGRQMRPIASLKMGTVGTSFSANADGSFAFDFRLSSLRVDDMITPKSLFPSIVRSLQSSSSSASRSSSAHAFVFRLSKSRSGDQDLLLRIVAFEVVASPLLVTEVKNFFALKKALGPTGGESKQNPMLRQSVSGSVDLFYDANEGPGALDVRETSPLVDGTAAAAATATAMVSDTISSAITDAWKEKNECKKTWIVDCNIHAPIVIIPQSCTDPESTILVFDLGNLSFVFGKEKPSLQIQRWFDSQPKRNVVDIAVDHGILEVRDLTFLMGRASDADWKMSPDGGIEEMKSRNSLAILEPVTVSLHVGIESSADKGNGDEKVRTCVFGVLPGISFQISPSQVARILSVAATWRFTLAEMMADPDALVHTVPSPLPEEGSIAIVEEPSSDLIFDAKSKLVIPVSPSVSARLSGRDSKNRGRGSSYVQNTAGDGKEAIVMPYLHVSFALRRLSARILTSSGDCLETHLVSVVASSSLMTDGSISSRVCMGWFWILDKLQADYPRRQRLVAHSSLPQSSESYAKADSYDIMKELRRQGVFEDTFEGSSDLADIKFTQSSSNQSQQQIEESANNRADKMASPLNKQDGSTTIIDATFTSLFINWNPYAIKDLLIMKTNILDFDYAKFHKSNSSPGSQKREARLASAVRTSSFRMSSQSVLLPEGLADAIEVGTKSSLQINAKMECLEINLNSAKDDLPLFSLNMSGASVKMHSQGENMTVSLIVGDVRMETPMTGRSDAAYKTILGLAPNQSMSLLSVRWNKGPDAIKACELDGLVKEKTEACAEIELSPMRFVYIHAQVMTLVEYVMEGVLGALFSSAASSAAAAAIEAAQADAGEKLFAIRATSFDLVVPQAANTKEQIMLNAGNLAVQYRSLPNDGGGQATLTLGNVSLECGRNGSLVESPIRMLVFVQLPPFELKSEDDRAIKVDVKISRAAFLLTKSQYRQIMKTLECNMGETDSFLRENASIFKAVEVMQVDQQGQARPDHQSLQVELNLTHGGVVAVEDPRRIYIRFAIEALKLELCGTHETDPIVSLAAVRTVIKLNLMPDMEQTRADLTLHNLVSEDRRLTSIDRYFRDLVSQANGKSGDVSQDVFRLSYVKYNKDGSMDIDIKVGSPQVVILPDLIVDLLQFVQLDSSQSVPYQSPVVEATEEQNPSSSTALALLVCNEEGEVEASLGRSVETKNMNVSIKTDDCRLVLVDMGNEVNLNNERIKSSSIVKVPTQLTEVVVFQGKMDSKLVLTSEQSTGNLVGSDMQVHGERVEVYTAEGNELSSPIQILEPAKFSIFMTTETSGRQDRQDMELRAVALSPIDITFSMQNAALLSAIVTSVSESIAEGNRPALGDDRSLRPLSDEETARIARLASALEKTDGWESDSNVSSREEEQVHSSGNGTESSHDQRIAMRRVVTVNATVPECALTVVNDLQGLDEALFRLIARNFVASGLFDIPSPEVSTSALMQSIQRSATTVKPEFNFHINTSFLADYLDSSTNLWEKLLTKPWELTVNGMRGPNKKIKSKRFSTAFDVESNACYISFSEQFLVSLGAAKKMWSMYSVATEIEETMPRVEKEYNSSRRTTASRKSLAAQAARSLITTMPYALENHSGAMAYLSVQCEQTSSQKDPRPCPTGTLQYFRFELPRGTGIGGKRLYGQEASEFKNIVVYVGENAIEIKNIDGKVNQPRRAHHVGHGKFVFTHVTKSGKATVLHLSSHVDVNNVTNLPFHIYVDRKHKVHDVGVCHGKEQRSKRRSKSKHSFSASFTDSKNFFVSADGKLSRPSGSFGIPIDHLQSFTSGRSGREKSFLSLIISPCLRNGLANSSLRGTLTIPSQHSLVQLATRNTPIKKFEVVCRPVEKKAGTEVRANEQQDSLVVQICCKVSLVDNCHPFIELYFQPRAVLENKIPVPLYVCTPMPHTFSSSLLADSAHDYETYSGRTSRHGQGEITHRLEPFEVIEIFTPGPSIAVSVKCADAPTGGGVTGWLDGGWVDLPLGCGRRLLEPIRCIFPFVRKGVDPLARSESGGSEFFIGEAKDLVSEISLERETKQTDIGASRVRPKHTEDSSRHTTSLSSVAHNDPNDELRVLCLTVCTVAIDHCGDILFEQMTKNKFAEGSAMRRSSSEIAQRTHRKSRIQIATAPFSAFASGQRRIALLPDSSVYIRLIQLTMVGEYGMKRSLPFRVKDISLCEGGVESTAVKWEDSSMSGLFAYRKLASSYQSELHIVPEFVVFNGGRNDKVLLKQPGGHEMILAPGQMAPIRSDPKQGLIISVDFIDLGCSTVPLRVDALRLKICIVRNYAGTPLGSLAVQTVLGAQDSRFVVKIGQIKYGGIAGMQEQVPASEYLFADDFFRFRIRWSEMQITLHDTQQPESTKSVAVIESALDRYTDVKLSQKDADKTSTWMEARKRHDETMDKRQASFQTVAQVLLHRFTVDYQRIFKDNELASGGNKSSLQTPERSQLALIVHNIKIMDCTPETKFPVVFESTTNRSFFDLCIRFRGSHNADLVKVDLIDLNLAYGDGKSDPIVVKTSEDFVWRVLDVSNRIVVATAELAGVDLQLEWDEENGGYIVSVADFSHDDSVFEEDNDTTTYEPPKSDKLYDIKNARVSPVTLLVSFKRQPQRSRYAVVKGGHGAKLVNYFTTKLKFTVDNAELKFDGYIARNVKGPPDRLIEMITAVYSSRLKLKLLSLVSAVSLQDWKYLAAREDGGDSFVEGDILRMTGNLAGRSAGYVLKKVGDGLGDGFSSVTGTIGSEFQNATEFLGIGAVGAGVNSVVTGIGDGVGTTVKGVGKGAGNILRGTVKGIGQVAGGVGGGVLLAGKGIGRGVMTGDGKAVVSGFGDGVTSIGTGVGQGVETAVMGAADGVLSVGHGVFSGVKSVGRGLGGIFSGGRKHER